MARMLGRAARQGFNCPCCSPRSERPFAKRSRRRAEQRRVRAESDAWFRAPATYNPGSDPSDCAHGCNGDCETWGSERCTFLCHPTDDAVLATQWAERTGHTTPAGDPDPGVLAAYAEHVQRGREEAEDRADLAIALAVLADPGECVLAEDLFAEFGL